MKKPKPPLPDLSDIRTARQMEAYLEESCLALERDEITAAEADRRERAVTQWLQNYREQILAPLRRRRALKGHQPRA